MRIQVRGTAPYNSDDVVVSDSLTVAELRRNLLDRFNIDSATHSIRLLYRGRLMQDANSVSSYGVEEGSTVHIVVQTRQPDSGSSGGGGERSAGPNQQQQPFTMPQFAFSAGGNGGYVSGGAFSWQPFASTIANTITTAFQQQQQQQQTAPQGWSMPSPTPPASGNSPHVAFSYEMGSGMPMSDGTAAAGAAGSGGADAAASGSSNPAVAATVNALTSQLPWLISSVLSNSLYGNAGAPQSQQQQQQHSTAGATPAETAGGPAAPAGPDSARAGASTAVTRGDATQGTADAAVPDQREGPTPASAPPQPPAAHTSADAVGGPAPQPTLNFTAASPPRVDVFVSNSAPPMPLPHYPQQQSSVVHIHVHCTPEELDEIPERLQRLAAQITVGQVSLQTDSTNRNSYRQAPQQEQQPQHPRATPPLNENHTSASASSDTRTPWINEAMSATLATLGMPQLMQLAAGNYSLLSNLRAPLWGQVQQRLDGTSGSLAAMANVAQDEARQLSDRILNMPAVQSLMAQQTAAATSAGRTAEEALQRVGAFRQELPRYLQHFCMAIMQHLSRSSMSAAEWSREMRNIVVRYVGMLLSTSTRWFEDGSLAFQPSMANILQTLLQSSGLQQQYPMLQAFSAMLNPMLQSLLGQWGREYDQSMRRSDDNLQFEQDASQQATSPLVSPPTAPVSKRAVATDRGGDDASRMDDDFEDLAKELMEDASSAASQEATKVVTPASAEETRAAGGAAAAVAASQARLASVVEDWEDACDVPPSVAERVRLMASRYVEAHALPMPSTAPPNLDAESASMPQAPPPSHEGQPCGSTPRADSDDWVTWEANPYGTSASCG
ncbi:hypothetical protein LSCM1_05887 [Leishmania martiniquensis]|uniref:Ubiquitin-like domain-containing protein n=1 Tax=Leishmania martiniquensis TaxID=1580590 RepID=A0A836H1F2_9TRYP|nr:hypothetical protein LSCM1_05887 [Leishmania martiniquensis]